MIVNRRDGFTMIELLVTVVIIGTIASFVTTSIRSLRDRAENTKTSDGVAVYEKALVAYAQDNGRYPDADAGGGVGLGCLGSNYPDLDGDGDGDCFQLGGYTTSESPYPTEELKEYIGDKTPFISDHPVVLDFASSQTWHPGHYRIGNLSYNGGTTELQYLIRYALEGEGQDCNQSPLVYFTTTTNFDEVVGRNYSRTYGGITFCDLYLGSESSI